MNALELRHVSRQYPDFLLDDITLALPSGCIMGLVGENGAGKSTLIRLLYGGLRPDSGQITLLGQSDPEGLRTAREDIGIVLDEGCFPENLSARQIGHILRHLYQNWDDEVFFGYLSRFCLPEKRRSRISPGACA